MSHTQRRLLLVRHAQGSLGSANYDQLSPTGFRQAEYVAAHIESLTREGAMVRGELERHRQTADYLRRFGECRTDPDLNEYRVDHLLAAAFRQAEALAIEPPAVDAVADPGRYLNTFLALFPTVLKAWQSGQLECGFNGCWNAFSRRVEIAGHRLSLLLEEAGTVIAVTSAGVISTLTASLLGQELAWQRRLNVTLYNGSITELHRDAAGGWEVARLNCVAHLPRGKLRTLA